MPPPRPPVEKGSSVALGAAGPAGGVGTKPGGGSSSGAGATGPRESPASAGGACHSLELSCPHAFATVPRHTANANAIPHKSGFAFIGWCPSRWPSVAAAVNQFPIPHIDGDGVRNWGEQNLGLSSLLKLVATKHLPGQGQTFPGGPNRSSAANGRTGASPLGLPYSRSGGPAGLKLPAPAIRYY
jgi:hypothetical protein